MDQGPLVRVTGETLVKTVKLKISFKGLSIMDAFAETKASSLPVPNSCFL